MAQINCQIKRKPSIKLYPGLNNDDQNLENTLSTKISMAAIFIGYLLYLYSIKHVFSLNE